MTSLIIAICVFAVLIVVGVNFCDTYEEAKKEGYVKKDDEGGL